MNNMKKLLLLILLLCTPTFASDLIQGEVTKVIDGDTITVKTKKREIKVRLYGIDAPEKKQDYGKESTKLLSKLIGDQLIKVYVVNKDRYGRLIGKIFFKGEYINLTMVKEGAAWHYKQYSKDVELAIAEDWARQEHDGLWQKENPTAPWNYRHGTATHSRAPPEKHEKIQKPAQEERQYWLNTKSYKRHNRSCRWFGNTKNGRYCTKDEGSACGICGG